MMVPKYKASEMWVP